MKKLKVMTVVGAQPEIIRRSRVLPGGGVVAESDNAAGLAQSSSNLRAGKAGRWARQARQANCEKLWCFRPLALIH